MSPILHMCHMLGTEMIHFVHQMQYYITFEVRTRGLRGGGGAPCGYPSVPNTSHVSHAGNRNDPLCPSDAVLHHLRGKNKGPEGGGGCSLRVPRCPQHFTCVTCWEQTCSTVSIRCSSISLSRLEKGGPEGGTLNGVPFSALCISKGREFTSLSI